jgi:hypothetical protein
MAPTVKIRERIRIRCGPAPIAYAPLAHLRPSPVRHRYTGSPTYAALVFRVDGTWTVPGSPPRHVSGSKHDGNPAAKTGNLRVLELSHRMESAMQITTSPLSWLFGAPRWEARVAADADRLIRDHGDGAYAAAADLSWREDVGLLRVRDAGHWSRVTLEIGRRLVIAEPMLPLTPAATPSAGVASSLRH